jgi:hypothetical protein
MFARVTAVVALSVVLIATGIALGWAHVPGRAGAECPFTDWDPDTLTRAETEACQAFFAAGAPDRRFAPGSRSFSMRFCKARQRYDECQQVRVPVCRFAVEDGQFPSVRSCLAATPGVRQFVSRESPRASVILHEPWYYYENGSLWPDPEIGGWFPGDRGFIDFHRPPRYAWDSRSGRAVPFPRDLVRFVARNPYLRVVGTRTFRLGGVMARQIDIVVRRGDARARQMSLCGEYAVRDEPCVPITADRDEEGYTSISVEPRHATRLTDVRIPSGRIIVVVQVRGSFTQLSGTERIVRTLRLG